MTEELEQLLKNLKLKRMLSVYDEHLRAAEKADVSYSAFVAGLLRAQGHDRQDGAPDWRIRRAKMPERWSLDTFPWARQPGLNASRCALSPNSTSSPSTRTWCSWGRPAGVRRDSHADSC